MHELLFKNEIKTKCFYKLQNRKIMDSYFVLFVAYFFKERKKNKMTKTNFYNTVKCQFIKIQVNFQQFLSIFMKFNQLYF